MPSGPRPTPPNRCIRAAFEGTYGGTHWTNVMWFYATGAGLISHANLVTFADAVFGAYVDNILKSFSTASALNLVQVVLYENDEPLEANSLHAVASGTVGGAAAPANVAACISWPISAHYRGGHPRTYMGGVPDSACANGSQFDGTWRTGLIARANAFHTACEGLPAMGGIATVEHGIVSFVKNKVWRDPPVFRRITTGAYVDTRIDTMRRRLGRDVA